MACSVWRTSSGCAGMLFGQVKISEPCIVVVFFAMTEFNIQI